MNILLVAMRLARRKTPRKKLQFPVEVHAVKVKHSVSWLEGCKNGYGLDISPYGAQLEIFARLEPQDLIAIRFSLLSVGRKLKVTARVTSVRPLGSSKGMEGKVRAGVEFIEMSPEDKKNLIEIVSKITEIATHGS